MDWSFLTDETQITARYYGKTSETPERCEIRNSQGQVFLHFRTEEDPNAEGDCDCTALKALLCCCFKQSMTGSSKSIASHPSFGDVINSQDQAIEFCCALFNFSSTIEEAFYSGGQLLGSFKIEKKGPCSGYEGFLIDAYSNPLMTSEINMESNTEVFKQGEEVACTTQINVDSQGATGTALFKVHLPIPLKLCFLMRTAQLTHERLQENSEG